MNLKRLLMVLLVSCLAIAANAQDKTVTGKVTDAKDGSALPGATVQVKGTKEIAQTNAEGIFKIRVPSGSTTLVISYSGFANQEVNIGSGEVNVSMKAISNNLNELVVVAYGTRKKGDLTGSVTSVSEKDFQKGNIASSEQLLQGKVAGLQITTGGGYAGGGSTIRIRGGASLNASNDPLIVIDGVPVEGNGINGGGNLLNNINPNDIESMSVLKDASATALYGSRASNGVIIITTKKGSKGKIKFNYNTQLSAAKVAKKVDVFTGDEIRSIVKATGKTNYINLLGTANTDWQDQIYQTAVGFDNNLSASGAMFNNKLPFRLSTGYLSQEGVLKTDKFNRTSVALNLSPKFLNDHLSVNVNAKYAQTKYHHANADAVGAAASFDPTQSLTQTNKNGGNFEWYDGGGNIIGIGGGALAPNPLSLLQFRNNNETINRFLGNVQLDYKLHFFPDLHILANLGLDKTKQVGDDNIDSTLVTNASTQGRYSHYAQNKTNTIAEVSLFYSKDLKKINSKIDVLIGHSYQDFVTDVFNYDVYRQTGQYVDATPSARPKFATDKPENRLESYIARLNYTFNNKYLLTASLRRDASSKFSTDNRVGYFPSVAAAWKVKEDLLAKSKTVSDLKLRVSYGVTGQQDGIGNYDYIVRYSQGTGTAQYQFGNNFYTFLRPLAYASTLKWETTTTANIGLDFGFLKNRVTGTIDVYNKKTKDLLSPVNQAPGQNFDILITTNVGNLENKGVEFTLNTVPVATKEITWNVGFNIAYNKTEITKLQNIADPSFTGFDVSGISGGTGNLIGKHQVGYAPYTYYMNQQVYDAATGRPIEGLYNDINRDGVGDDRYFNSKSPAPTVTYGFNTQLSYRKWSFGFSAHGSYNSYLYNNYASRTGVLNAILNGSIISNGSRDYLNTGFVNQQYLSDYYLQNGSFLRMDNINVGYNFGKVYRNKASLRMSANVQNAFIITKYKGLDPENSSSTGIDNNIYPRPRIFSVMASLDF